MPEELTDPVWYRYTKGIMCGTTAGITITLIGHPFDTVKVRLQTQSPQNPVYIGVIDCVKKTIKWEGISGLYRGMASPVTGQIIFRTALFTSYFESCRFIQKSKPDLNLKTLDYFLAGAITGLISGFSESSIELFKSKMQYQIISEKLNKPLSMRYNGSLHCFAHTLKHYGIRGVFQGLGPTLCRDTIGYSLYFGFNEYFKRIMTPKGKNVSELGLMKFILAAGLSGIIFWTTVFNIDVIKSAMMADDIDRKRRKYSSMYDCAKKLYREGGYSRFWRGYIPCLLRSFPANALMLYVVDVTRKYFPSYKSTRAFINDR